MHDIAHYAGFLKPETQETINRADLPKLSLTLEYAAAAIAEDYYYNDDNVVGVIIAAVSESEFAKLSSRDRLSLIRGLCDRIELKLMEAAK